MCSMYMFLTYSGPINKFYSYYMILRLPILRFLRLLLVDKKKERREQVDLVHIKELRGVHFVCNGILH